MEVDDDGTQASAIPAGWYPDVNSPGSERYWDGSGWTAQTRAVVSDADVTTPEPEPEDDVIDVDPFAATPATAGASAPADLPRTAPWLWTSVATTLFCLPVAVAGIIMAGKADTAYAAGDYTGGASKAKAAKVLALIATAVAVITVALLIFSMVGLVSAFSDGGVINPEPSIERFDLGPNPEPDGW